MAKKIILITGAVGYIGSSLVSELSKDENNEIIIHCRTLSDYFSHWRDNHLVIESDILDKSKLLDSLKSIDKIDLIIHLATFNDVSSSKKDPTNALLVNGIGTRNILDIALEKKCDNIIFFSTIQVYGSNLNGKIDVCSKLRCETDYALTHYVGEEYCRMYSNLHGLNCTVVRPSNVYGILDGGGPVRWNLVPSCFCKSVVENGKIVLNSSGKQKKDFVSLAFVVKNIMEIIDNFKTGFNIYNISSQCTYSILELAEIVNEIYKTDFGGNSELIVESDEPKEVIDFEVVNNLSGFITKDKLDSEIKLNIKNLLNNLVE